MRQHGDKCGEALITTNKKTSRYFDDKDTKNDENKHLFTTYILESYRMLNDTKCSEKELSKALYNSCESNIHGQHLLCIQDTTQVDYFSHKGRIKDLDANVGHIDNATFGYLCHPMLVIDADKNMPIGFWKPHELLKTGK